MSAGVHSTTIAYKKLIFEQRELFQVRKIYNEFSGKKTQIFSLLKNFCKYSFSPNELSNNVLLKTYLGRLGVSAATPTRTKKEEAEDNYGRDAAASNEKRAEVEKKAEKEEQKEKTGRMSIKGKLVYNTLRLAKKYKTEQGKESNKTKKRNKAGDLIKILKIAKQRKENIKIDTAAETRNKSCYNSTVNEVNESIKTNQVENMKNLLKKKSEAKTRTSGAEKIGAKANETEEEKLWIEEQGQKEQLKQFYNWGKYKIFFYSKKNKEKTGEKNGIQKDIPYNVKTKQESEGAAKENIKGKTSTLLLKQKIENKEIRNNIEQEQNQVNLYRYLHEILFFSKKEQNRFIKQNTNKGIEGVDMQQGLINKQEQEKNEQLKQTEKKKDEAAKPTEAGEEENIERNLKMSIEEGRELNRGLLKQQKTKGILQQYLNNINWVDSKGGNTKQENIENSTFFFASDLQLEQIYANYTNETNLIPSLFLGAVHPTLESKNNIEKDKAGDGPSSLVAEKKEETATLLKNEKNTERQQIKNKGEQEQIEIAENIYLLPFLYEKSTKGIQENAPIHPRRGEGGTIDRKEDEEYILNNEKNKKRETYPWKNSNKDKREADAHPIYILTPQEITNNIEERGRSNIKEETQGNKVGSPTGLIKRETEIYIPITSLILTLNRLIHKKSVEFIFNTNHMYTSLFYLKYYWYYLYNHFYPNDSIDWIKEVETEDENYYFAAAEKIKDLGSSISTSDKNEYITIQNKKILSSNLHVQYLKSRYYLKMVNSGFKGLTKNIKTGYGANQKNINTYGDIKEDKELNQNSGKENNVNFKAWQPTSEMQQSRTEQSEKREESENKQEYKMNSDINKGGYTKKLIALLIYKKKAKAVNFLLNDAALSNSNTNQGRAFVTSHNRNKLTLLQTDTTLYNTLGLKDLCF